MKPILLSFIIITSLFLTIDVNSKDVCFTKKEAEEIITRLERDKKLIKSQSKKWKALIESTPKITYKVLDNEILIQTVEFPIKNDKPLIYEVKSKIILKKAEKPKYFPLNINLAGMGESGVKKYVDAKLGLEIFSFAPLSIFILERFSLHAMVGIQSTGLSISYQISKKYLKNTRVHFYTGFAYTVKPSYGGGISLNF